MIDQPTFDRLLQLAYQWAQAQEEFVLAFGAPLNAQHTADARLCGIREPERVRVLLVDRIPVPESGELGEAARRTRIITEDTRCVGFGHALFVRADAWGDRELLLHNFIHIAQCERCGGLESWIAQYLGDRHSCPSFTIGSFEEEARTRARQICQEHPIAA